MQNVAVKAHACLAPTTSGLKSHHQRGPVICPISIVEIKGGPWFERVQNCSSGTAGWEIPSDCDLYKNDCHQNCQTVQSPFKNLAPVIHCFSYLAICRITILAALSGADWSPTRSFREEICPLQALPNSLASGPHILSRKGREHFPSPRVFRSRTLACLII